MDEQKRAREIMQPHINFINKTPALLSLLYDADMLPEQVLTVRGAINVVVVVTAYQLGLKGSSNG